MNITSRIETRKDVKAICVHLKGDYQTLNYMEAWNKLGEYCHANHIDYDCPNAEYINIYRDNPATTAADACRTDVCIASSAVDEQKPSADVDIITIYGGRYLVYGYQGPYEMLGAVNAKIYGELLPQSGEKIKLSEGVIEHCQMNHILIISSLSSLLQISYILLQALAQAYEKREMPMKAFPSLL